MNIDSWMSRDNEVAKAMRLIAKAAEYVATGQERVAYFCGPPGVGKSHAIRSALDRFRARGLAPVFCNPADYREMVRAFAETRGVRPIVFEEADVIFERQRMINILKLATADKLVERIYAKVLLTAPILVSTNRDLSSLDRWPKDQRIHIEALFNRCVPIVIPDDRHDLWEYSCFIALTTPLIQTDSHGDGISLRVRVAALEWFTANMWRLKTVSPRTLMKVANAMAWTDPETLEMRLRGLIGMTDAPLNATSHDWRGLILGNSPAPMPLMLGFHAKDRKSLPAPVSSHLF